MFDTLTIFQKDAFEKANFKKNLQTTKKHVKLLNEPVHEISNNVVCMTSEASDQPAQSDQSLC